MACYALPAPLASRDLQAAFVLQSDLRAAEVYSITDAGRVALTAARQLFAETQSPAGIQP
jgi:hypothetical protein